MTNWTCPSCHTQNVEADVLCQVCGVPLAPTVPVAVVSPAPLAPPLAGPATPAARPNEPPAAVVPPTTTASWEPAAPARRGIPLGAAIAVVALVLVAAVALVVVLTGGNDSGSSDAGTPDGSSVTTPPDPSTTEIPTTVASTTPEVATTTAPVLTVGPSASDSGFQPAVAALSTYFAAINAHDFATAHAALSPSQQAKVSQAQMAMDADTTHDSDIYVESIAPGPSGGLAADVSFTSTQSAEDSRFNTTCTRWRIRYELIPSGSTWVIDGTGKVDGAPISVPC